MKIDLMVFSNEEFGSLEVVTKDGKQYFHATQCAKMLGYTNPQKAIRDHCKGVNETLTPTKGGNQVVKIIPEGDLYRLIVRSKLPSAEKFEKWVFDEVLPQIRQTLSTLESIDFKANIDNMVYSRDGRALTTSNRISEITGKAHRNIVRDIRDEITLLEEIHCSDLSSEIQVIINDFKEVDYLSNNGQIYKEFELGELATMQILLRYSTEHRARFIIAFAKMKQALMNMFKARVLEEVFPQDNRFRQFVYVLKNPLNNVVKIGVAQNVNKRIKQLETGAGVELELVYQSLVCSNAFEIEKKMHEHFSDRRVFGEWFNVDSDEVVNFLENQNYVLKSEFTNFMDIKEMGERNIQ